MHRARVKAAAKTEHAKGVHKKYAFISKALFFVKTHLRTIESRLRSVLVDLIRVLVVTMEGQASSSTSATPESLKSFEWSLVSILNILLYKSVWKPKPERGTRFAKLFSRGKAWKSLGGWARQQLRLYLYSSQNSYAFNPIMPVLKVCETHFNISNFILCTNP